MSDDLEEFITPIPSLLEPLSDEDQRAWDKRHRQMQKELEPRLREFKRARGRALVASQFYWVGSR